MSKKAIHEPWKIDLSKRIHALTQSNGKKKIAYFYERADTSTFRYRVYNMCQALEKSVEWEGVFFFENELKEIENFLDKIDITIFCRVRWSLGFHNFFHQLKLRNIPLLFDVDDLVFDIKKVPLIMNTLNLEFCPSTTHDWFSYSARIGYAASFADGLTCTNAFLANHLKETLNKPTFIVNNFLNQQQIDFSNSIYEKKQLKGPLEFPFKIGYFSGTPSHANDFDKIAPEIRDLLNAYPEMQLEVVGFMEFPEYLDDLVDAKRITHHPLVDFLTLQEKIGAVDVNIVPLVDNEFTNCKSELKFFEAAIVGTITCATPTFVFRNSIDEGKTGFLCREGEWYSTIEKIYKKQIPESMVALAREECLKKYSPKSQLSSIEEVLKKF